MIDEQRRGLGREHAEQRRADPGQADGRQVAAAAAPEALGQRAVEHPGLGVDHLGADGIDDLPRAGLGIEHPVAAGAPRQ